MANRKKHEFLCLDLKVWTCIGEMKITNCYQQGCSNNLRIQLELIIILLTFRRKWAGKILLIITFLLGVKCNNVAVSLQSDFRDLSMYTCLKAKITMIRKNKSCGTLKTHLLEHTYIYRFSWTTVNFLRIIKQYPELQVKKEFRTFNSANRVSLMGLTPS